jgi:hypothetical protein
MWAHLLLAAAKMFGKTILLGSLTPCPTNALSHQGQMQHSGVRAVQSGSVAFVFRLSCQRSLFEQ